MNFVFEMKLFFSFAVPYGKVQARVAELVDALDSKSSSFGVWVRFPPRVHKSKSRDMMSRLFCA